MKQPLFVIVNVNMAVVVYIFRLSCIIFFLYLAVNVCFRNFINQEKITKTIKVNQQDYQRPLICITALEFNYAEFNSSLNITFDEYKEGRWKIGDLTEEESFRAVAPKLSHLIKSIEVSNTSGVIGDAYELIKTSVDDESLNKSGIEIIQKDYYHYLSNYCIKLRHAYYPNGVTKLILDTNPSPMALMVISPGKYYDRDRYFNQLRIEPEEDYGFTVR